MQTIHATQKTGTDGTLTLRVPLGLPDTEFEVVVVVQPKAAANVAADPWAAADAIRARLAASGRDFGDSAQDIREDRDLLQDYRTALISAAVIGQIDIRGDVE
jgi:hypothetical protein